MRRANLLRIEFINDESSDESNDESIEIMEDQQNIVDLIMQLNGPEPKIQDIDNTTKWEKSNYQDGLYIQKTNTGMEYVSTMYTPHRNIIQLICNNMKLKQLPQLPSTLKYLECRYNQLLYVKLPENIEYFNCHGNKYPIAIKLPNKDIIAYIPYKFYNKNYLTTYFVEADTGIIRYKRMFGNTCVQSQNTYTKNFKDLPIQSIKQKCLKLRTLHQHLHKQKEVSKKFYQEVL